MGTQGGGQHPGPPEGGGGAAMHRELKAIKNAMDIIYLAVI